MEYTRPQGVQYALYEDMLKQPHLLIGGATGSGKSVVINALLYTALFQTPEEIELILIDPKRVELVDYKQLPHTITYACEPETMTQALKQSMNIINSRYKTMQKQRVKMYNGSDVYIIIDELADLMLTNKREVQPLIQRIAQVGRAARVHLIGATQCPLAKVIPTQIKVNFDARIALRTRSAQDSRNLLGCKGCEMLPRYGQGYYMTPEGMRLYNIPMIAPEQLAYSISNWKRQKRRFSLFK